MAIVRSARSARASLLLVLVSVLGLAGCDSFSSLTVNCQVGIKNDGGEVGSCQFTNSGRNVAQSCVKVHVVRPARETSTGTDGEERTYVSLPLCSGPVEPVTVSEPTPLVFADADLRTVAEACMQRVDGEDRFACHFKIEEVGGPKR